MLTSLLVSVISDRSGIVLFTVAPGTGSYKYYIHRISLTV